MATHEQAKAVLDENGWRYEEERNKDDHGWIFRLLDIAAVVQVYDTGTCQVQGGDKQIVEAALGDLVGNSRGRRRGAAPAPPIASKPSSQDVFVVYGRDDQAKIEMEAMLRRWGLNPLLLDQLPSEGATLIEKLEKYQNNVGYAVVLATPDDEGFIKGEPDKRKPRARQNVVLELGMVLATVGRSRVSILLKDAANIERPSDIDGLIYKPFNRSVDEVKVDLAKDMASKGFAINWSQL